MTTMPGHAGTHQDDRRHHGDHGCPCSLAALAVLALLAAMVAKQQGSKAAVEPWPVAPDWWMKNLLTFDGNMNVPEPGFCTMVKIKVQSLPWQ